MVEIRGDCRNPFSPDKITDGTHQATPLMLPTILFRLIDALSVHSYIMVAY